MKVAYFAKEVSVQPGFEHVLSAHVQIALHSMNLIRGAGHSVELITTEFGDGDVLPAMLPFDIPIHRVPSTRAARIAKKNPARATGGAGGRPTLSSRSSISGRWYPVGVLMYSTSREAKD